MRTATAPNKTFFKLDSHNILGVISVTILSYIMISSVASFFPADALSTFSDYRSAAAKLLLFVLFAWIAAIHARATEKNTHSLEEAVARLDDHSRQMSALGETGQWFQACRSVEEVCRVARDRFHHLLPETSGALYLMNATSDALERAMTWGEITEGPDGFAPGDCWALRRGRPHRTKPEDGALACRHVHAGAADWHVCLPLTAHGEGIGVLQLSGHGGDLGSDGPDRQERARFYDTVAETLALAVANLRLRETLRLQAIRDPLTQLFNRRYFQETLPRELNRVARADEPLTLVMLDIDHFKQFNDSFGHDAGDAVLRAVGEVLNENTRLADVACRYGGEEFALVFPGMPTEVALRRMEAVRQQIEALEVVHGGEPLRQVTISAGVAVFPENAGDMDSLVALADRALYDSKDAGRNRVTLTPAPRERAEAPEAPREQPQADGNVLTLADHRRAS